MKLYQTSIFVFFLIVIAAKAEDLKITADSIKADSKSGAFNASGNVKATLPPLTITSDKVGKDLDGRFQFDKSTVITTCTNAPGHRHWCAKGKIAFKEGEYALMSNGILSLWEYPIMWLPFWYYPINTDYGWRVMPGYSSRTGAALYTKYVYNLAGSFNDGAYGLGASTRFDLRSENGVAVGQSLNWQLGEYGTGKIKVYYADDQDYDHYTKRWENSRHWNYRNWSSPIDRERWAVMLQHSSDITERDSLKISVSSFSDSYFNRDFLRDSIFAGKNSFDVYGTRNEVSWEHLEKFFSAGISFSGPIDEFYNGVMRLPEFYFDVTPIKVLDTPLTYESQTTVGYYNRQEAKYGDSSTSAAYKYAPGPWANYNTARFDTYHRVSAPLRVADIISVVPRIGYRGTFWGESGNFCATGYERAGTTSDSAWRSIYEAGVTFAARGSADYQGGIRHVVEPYFDVLLQESDYSGLKKGSRPYVFDNRDMSFDYLDQFAGRSRLLPYSWYGVTPGVRNVIRKTDEKGVSRTVFDFDAYAAVQFNDTEYIGASRWQKMSSSVEDPNYGTDDVNVMPGARMRWMPTEKSSISARAEWDSDNDRLAYFDFNLTQIESEKFSWYIQANLRDHRYWDYAPMIFDSNEMRKDMFNHARQKFAEIGFEYDIADSFAIGPYMIFDMDEGDIAEVGSWLDYRTDCLGFRFMLSYETEYERVDFSGEKSDFRFGFFIYLRALGPNAANPFKSSY